MIPRYLEYAGERVADSILAELQSAISDSATYGTAMVQRASHHLVNGTITAIGGPPVHDAQNPVVLVATWLLGALLLKWLA